MSDSSTLRARDGLAYCQQPTLRGDRVAFSAEGNLWEVGLEGGVARRLTSSSANHTFPRYSPDGQWLAFSSADEGPAAVWVMPAEGGTARRLTFSATPDQVVGWSPDGSRIVFRTMAVEGFRGWSLASVPMDGGAITAEPYGRANTIAYHADGRTVALNRHGSDPAWWKRYKGGRAGRIWIGDLETGAFERMPGGPRTDACPMWIGDQLWFLSDEDGMGDLWRANKDGSGRRRVTHHKEFFARWPECDGTRIVYALGARLFMLDASDANPTPREIEVDARGHSLVNRRKFVDVSTNISSAALSGNGSQAVFTVRGQIARMPNWHGTARILTGGEGVRLRDAQFLGDTEDLVAVRQSTEADTIVVLGQDGSEQRDLGGVGRRIRAIHPSPDGKSVAVRDQGRGLHVVDVASGESRLIDDTAWAWLRTATWSPCSTWIAYTAPRNWWQTDVKVAHAATGASHFITGGAQNGSTPSWDPAGRYLAFLSSRDLDPVSDGEAHDFNFPASTRAYVAMLRPGEPLPFAPETAPSEEPPERVTDAIEIEFAGICQRTCALPFERARYGDIACSTGGIAVLREPTSGMIEQSAPPKPTDAKNTVLIYDFTERKIDKAYENVTGWTVSSDGSTWLLRFGKRYRVRKTAKKADPLSKLAAQGSGNGNGDRPSPKTGWLDLGRIAVSVEPRAEFRQMFLEAWGQQRDHFYDEKLVNVNWEACRERYEPLLDRVRTRFELLDLLWEIQGELGTSHAYAMGGDFPRARSFKTGHLGCDLAQDDDGTYRIGRIYRGDAWKPDGHSPLAAPGKNVSEGDALLAINSCPVGADCTPGELLLETAKKQVVLTVADDANGSNSREVIVTPLADDKPLRYRAWVDGNAKRVEEATGGRIGYIHIPNMSLEGAIEFHRHFLWQVDSKEGLVIDNRYNGGGNISGILLEKLARKIVGWSKSRWGAPETYPRGAVRGPMVVLTNENAGSDGDIFSQAVKSRGIGPLIGMRTWGGVVGIDRAKDLVDGGYVTQPEYAFWFNGPGWGVENHGVEPDIEVDLTPADAMRGDDPQMDRAITEVMNALETWPQTPPDLGPKPDLRFEV